MFGSDEFRLGLYILDEDGNPRRVSDTLEWGRWFDENWGKLHVGSTDVGGRYWVSTVFLGLDHNWSRHHDSLPVLWETMIFETKTSVSARIELPADEPWQEPVVIPEREYRKSVGDQWRYTSKAAALKGHARAVAVAQRWCQEADAARVDPPRRAD